MWLTLLLDKSTLQGLGRVEMDVLGRYYQLALPPVLLAEVLGDLAKISDQQRPTWMAEKVSRVGKHASIDWPILLGADLVGNRVPMQGTVWRPSSKEVHDPEGGIIKFAGEQPAEKALRRWRDGNFTEAEQQAAKHWRELEKGLPPESILGAFDGIPLPQHIGSPAQLQAAVFGITSNLRNQERLLATSATVFGLDNETLGHAKHRWEAEGHRRFAVFAPYAAHCLRVALATALALQYGLVRTTKRAKPAVDMDYLFHLPFVRVFATSDRDQELLAHVLARRYQVVVDGLILKADLAAIKTYLQSMSPTGRQQHFMEYGPYAPKLPDSFTAGLAARWYRPRPPHAGRPIQLEGEDLERIEAEIRRKIDLLDLE